MQVPPFDRELAGWLPQPRLADLPLAESRALAPLAQDAALARGGRFEVSWRAAPGAPGQDPLPLLVCQPAGGAAPRPALYYIHGGGLVTGNATSGIDLALDWAERFGLAVVSVDYRLAPETPHPGPVEDCYRGLVWLSAQAGELGVDPGRVVVAGVSAGGGLAAATALMARDRSGPPVWAQLLASPMLDDRNNSASARQMVGSVWDARDNEIAWTALLGAERGGPGVSPYAAPARAADLAGLPPTFLDIGSAETFRDEVVDYAARLWRAGGDCELHVWPGGFHGFQATAPAAALSRAAAGCQAAWLERVLRQPPAGAAGGPG
ncbi:MAG: alpha/beta hydrolase [Bifidobacteriaceae bacterium]|jgi:acetyl esterase/lipase|nr:alpha/beta hydrolase [Bifidobacteriaceae bacterium]